MFVANAAKPTGKTADGSTPPESWPAEIVPSRLLALPAKMA